MRQITRIELDQANPFLTMTFDEWQALYLSRETGDLKPNTEIWTAGTLRMKINSLGAKGYELEKDKKILGVFGDSGTFGVSDTVESWPGLMKINGYQVLNASVEGYSLDRALNKYLTLKDRVKFSALMVYAGWHNLVYGQSGPIFWRSVYEQFKGDHKLVICTLLSSLTEECRTRGVDELLCEYEKAQSENKRFYAFWGSAEPTKELIGQILDAQGQYHAFLADFCKETGSHLLDLNSYMKPASYQAIPDEFFDICHPHRATYPKIAKFAEQTLNSFLNSASQKIEKTSFISRLFSGRKVKSQPDKKGETRDYTQDIYPLW